MQMKKVFLFGMVCFLCHVTLASENNIEGSVSDVSSIILCEQKNLFDNILTPIGSITDTNQIAIIMSEVSTNSVPSGYMWIGVLCHLVFLNSSSNIVNAGHIINYNFTVDMHNDVVQVGGEFKTVSTTNDWMCFSSKVMACIVYDALQEQAPDIITKLDNYYLKHPALKKTTKEMLEWKIEVEEGEEERLKSNREEERLEDSISPWDTGAKEATDEDFWGCMKEIGNEGD